jgi:hypothetical protein
MNVNDVAMGAIAIIGNEIAIWVRLATNQDTKLSHSRNVIGMQNGQGVLCETPLNIESLHSIRYTMHTGACPTDHNQSHGESARVYTKA